MDWALYWFMFPVSIVVAVAAMLSGIGGTALFTPIFLLVFPVLGDQYTLANPAVAFAASLLTATCGFGSGYLGYAYRRLVDYRTAWPFVALGAPAAVAGALYAQRADPALLRSAYALAMIALAVFLVLTRLRARPLPGASSRGAQRVIRARDGEEYRYRAPRQGAGAVATGAGGLLSGMLSVGIGEVVMPQLVARHRVPVPVAAATSVLVVVSVFICAAATHVYLLVSKQGFAGVPWHLVVYTVPGVIIGGQLAPRLQGRVSERRMVQSIAVLFGLIGLAMGASAV